ncbi:4-hydroxyphenylpyruvate dioxygenase-like protein [Chionoecetes opilio]|uniref:4-hydroxyphenylpyruvate dioxygenase-like protein n=1 Tax=Chionoecetes opilio TaxID=41210 RepID=A0A8J4YGH5_CHIOP|nr:4-hydroxyphenylpyruvate dioxygenase-like protein [Chionoecetes opilio]
MCTSGLHHVEICVGEENDLMNLLIRGFGFKLIAQQITPLSLKWAVKHGSAVFVITKRRKHHIQQHGSTDEYSNCDQAIHEQTLKFPLIGNDGHSNDLEHWTVFCCQNQTSHVIDSVFNVALVVNDVDEVTKRVKAQGGNVVREPTIVKDGHGQVRYSIVTSCFGNVVHTLIDRQDYSGEFLPGFERLQHSDNESKRDLDEFSSNNSDIKPYVKESSILNEVLKKASTNYSQFWSNNDLDGDLFTHFDHVAYVCEPGKSKELMKWYECCFGAKRYEINREDTEEEGFMLSESVVNMRLKAMEYWRCAEAGLTMPSSTSEGSSLKIVIAESLNGNARKAGLLWELLHAIVCILTPDDFESL